MRINHHHRLQRGISLIESMVAIVVMALGILGILGVQMRTLADTQTGVRRAQAIRLIEDLSERMKVNPNALGSLGNYTTGWGRTGHTGSELQGFCLWHCATRPIRYHSVEAVCSQRTAFRRRKCVCCCRRDDCQQPQTTRGHDQLA